MQAIASDRTAEDMAIERVLQLLTAKYGEPIGEGLARIVFDAGRWVIKVPRQYWYYNDNYREASLGARKCKNETFAICRLFHIHNVPVLWMEKVEPAKYSNDMPD